MSDGNSSNPGTVLASQVDAKMAEYRAAQESIQKLRGDLQTILGQSTENEMVLSELKLLEDDDTNDTKNVYKLVGPALIRQDVDEAVQTVRKRLEFILGEQTKLTRAVEAKEAEALALAKEVQSMQAALQQSTAAAVQAIAAQHGGGR